MSGPFGSAQWMYSSGGFYSFPIEQSLRVNDDDSSYLSWTPSAAGNLQTWTWSGWVKRGNLGSRQSVFTTSNSAGNDYIGLEFQSNDTLVLSGNNGSASVQVSLTTSALFRDTSAWYHIVLFFDTTQATASERVGIYINGERITSFSSATYPPQNYNGRASTTVQHNIGSYLPAAGLYLDGYLAEVNFIDGQALDASSFGEFKSGVWIPKQYSGSYGTNGFHLEFANSGSLGTDTSGNGNNWTANNLAATDQLLDSPTNNFGTMNPNDDWVNTVLSQGNLQVGTNSTYGIGKGNFWMTSGKWYWEFTPLNIGAYYPNIGVKYNEQTGSIGGGSSQDVTYWANGQKFVSGVLTAYGSSYTTGDVIAAALDMDSATKTITFYKNGVSQGPITLPADQYTANINVASGAAGGGTLAVVNFGQDSSFAGNKTAQGNTDENGYGDFYYAPPSGYLALCTANLPDPVIDPAKDDTPSDYFTTALYTGTGSTINLNTIGFQPDLTWIKGRSLAFDHGLFDSVRGGTKQLYSNLTNAEYTWTNGITFDSEGVDISADSNLFNGSGYTYAAWNWKAGNGTSSNTDGSITSTVSVNQKAGFSVVSYTGTGSATSVGHGLGATPAMYITKRRDAANSWIVYHKELGNNVLALESTSGLIANSNLFSSYPNSIAFYPSTSSTVNASGSTYITYCFAEVEGYSKFSSYTGNGSTDGPFVYTGFKPAWLMVKRTNSASDWVILDTARDDYNIMLKRLDANSGAAENTAASYLDSVSNGFKIRTTNGNYNTSGSTYIYMAFAESPFKYSNAR